ncbi:Crp/Fnr family transcriptional regulator [Myroides sp. LJL116]
MDLLLKNIALHINLSEQEQQQVLSYFIKESYPSKTRLVEAEKQISSTYFVLSGILRNYYVDQQGNEHTLSFSSSGWWMADMYSFLSQSVSSSYIEVLEQSEVLILTRENQTALFENVPKMERYFRILLERSLIANSQRIIDNLSLSAQERYERFNKRYPTIKNCLAQKQIASYLGVTPEFFSKMKRNLLKNPK